MDACRCRAGVAVWEVLIVLAILVLLAAVLLPVFQKAHDANLPRTSCISHLQHLGMAYAQYGWDSDEKAPAGVNAAGSGWAGQLYRFDQDRRSTNLTDYACPQDTAPGSHISYAENQNLPDQTLALLDAPAVTVELYELTTPNCDPSTPETVSAVGLSAPQNDPRHDAQTFRLNFLAADGHLKPLTPCQVSGGPAAVKPKKLGAFVLTFAVH